MKNLTVTVPDDVYRAARIRAAERGVSVSALVAEYLRSLDAHAEEFRRRQSEQDRILTEISRFRANDRLTREELHERAVR